MIASRYSRNRETQPFEVGLKFSFHRFRKFRLYLAWLFVVVLAIFAKSTNQGFWIGAPVIATGEIIRIWSHGYLRKARQLATNGPYAYVRNPLYLGNFLIGFGFCLIIWHSIIGVIFIVGFFLVYWLTIRGEEQRLAFKFGDAYAEYCRKVPRFLPRLSPYKRMQKAPFALHRVWGHGEHITILAIIELFLLLYLRQEFYQNQAFLTPVTFGLGIVVAVSGVLLGIAVASRWLKSSRKHK